VRPHVVACDGVFVHGWRVSTRKGPIISDRDVDAFRQGHGLMLAEPGAHRVQQVHARFRQNFLLVDTAIACRDAVGEGVKALPEMLFSSSRITLLHEPSGVALDFTALGALRGWLAEGLPPLQVKVAKVR
jgi:hypothetical protein